MQGKLLDTELSIEISTGCACREQPIRLAVDTELNYRILEGGPALLVFEPDVDWAHFTDPNIIHGS